MIYISAKEAAERWGISVRYAQRLISQQRIPGAKKYQRSWMIPADAKKPEDLRKAQKTKEIQTVSYLSYRTPIPLTTVIYSLPGSAEAVLKKVKKKAELAALCDCQLACFRGEIDKAGKKAAQMLADASCFDTKIGAYLILAVCAIYAGNIEQWKRAEEKLSGLTCASQEDRDYLAFWIAGMRSAIYDKVRFPEWFRRGCFDPLPAESYPLARFYYLKYIMSKKDAVPARPDFTAVAEPLISQTKLEGVLISEAYQRLLAAIAYHDEGNDTMAVFHIDRVLEITLPDRLYGILAEYSSPLDFLLFRRLRKADRNAYDAVVALNKRLLEGWTTLHNHVMNRNATNEWTIREREAVKLAVRGFTNQQIADRLHLSINTVKQRLGSAMEKVGVKKRKDLSEFL